MTFEEYREFEKEVHLYKGEYDEQTVRTSPLQGKWHAFLLMEKKKLRALQNEKKKALLERSNYYLGKSPTPYEFVVLKTDLSRYLDADPAIQSVEDEIGYQEDLVQYILNVISRLNNRNFMITNCIKWVKFENGLND